MHKIAGVDEELTLCWASGDDSQIHKVNMPSQGNLHHPGEEGHLLKLRGRGQEVATITTAAPHSHLAANVVSSPCSAVAIGNPLPAPTAPNAKTRLGHC